MPLGAMAAGFARLASCEDAEPRRIVRAMTARPDLVAGHGRLCTDLMQAFPGRVVAKVGAEGVYGAALVDEGVGVALKVEDGNWRACNVALLAVLEQLGLPVSTVSTLDRYRIVPVLDTRREQVGVMRVEGEIALAR
jgi:L-asparaginase II